MNWLLLTADLLTAMAEVCRRYGESPVVVDEPATLAFEVIRPAPSVRGEEKS